MKNILFDLDGTLSDPADGTINSYRYVFKELGKSCPPVATLLGFIGPPLTENFGAILGKDKPELVQKAVSLYRYHYDTQNGLFENRLYSGVPALLENLKSAGKSLYIATSKPTAVAERIVEHFGIRPLFQAVYGHSVEAPTKGTVIAKLLDKERIGANEAVMVGDRSHDVAGAGANGLSAIGVTWGYGSREELRAAGASAVVDNMTGLFAVLMKPARPRISLERPRGALEHTS